MAESNSIVQSQYNGEDQAEAPTTISFTDMEISRPDIVTKTKLRSLQMKKGAPSAHIMWKVVIGGLILAALTHFSRQAYVNYKGKRTTLTPSEEIDPSKITDPSKVTDPSKIKDPSRENEKIILVDEIEWPSVTEGFEEENGLFEDEQLQLGREVIEGELDIDVHGARIMDFSSFRNDYISKDIMNDFITLFERQESTNPLNVFSDPEKALDANSISEAWTGKTYYLPIFSSKTQRWNLGVVQMEGEEIRIRILSTSNKEDATFELRHLEALAEEWRWHTLGKIYEKGSDNFIKDFAHLLKRIQKMKIVFPSNNMSEESPTAVTQKDSGPLAFIMFEAYTRRKIPKLNVLATQNLDKYLASMCLRKINYKKPTLLQRVYGTLLPIIGLDSM